jgi:uncharacterized protein (TIGR03437 family)
MLMSRKTKITVGKIAAISLVIPALIVANSFGPLPRNTGAPGDRTCARATTCHIGTADSGPGRIEFTGPGGYVSGIRQTWLIDIIDPDGQQYGVQVSTRPADDPQFGQAGRLETAQPNTIVLCENGTIRVGDASCSDSLPIEFFEHDMAQTSRQFLLEWIPPESDIGDVKIFVAGNAVDGLGTPRNDQVYTAELTLQPLTFDAAPVVRGTQPVLQAFDNQERLSPGTYVQIFGDNLAASQRSWNGADFDVAANPPAPGANAPTVLDGVEVLVNGVNAYISFVSPNQINAQVPDGIGEGVMDVAVRHPGGISNNATVTVTAVSPALQQDAPGRWTSGETEYVMALHQPLGSNVWVGPEGLLDGLTFRPAKPGEIITLFILGCGTSESYPAGQIPSTAAPLGLPFEIRIGDVAANAAAVASPQFVGLFQFNVTVPNLPAGDHRITLAVDGIDSGQTLFTSVAQP